MVRPNGSRMGKNGRLQTPKQMLASGQITEDDIGYKQVTLGGKQVDVMVVRKSMEDAEKPFTKKPQNDRVAGVSNSFGGGTAKSDDLSWINDARSNSYKPVDPRVNKSASLGVRQDYGARIKMFIDETEAGSPPKGNVKALAKEMKIQGEHHLPIPVVQTKYGARVVGDTTRFEAARLAFGEKAKINTIFVDPKAANFALKQNSGDSRSSFQKISASKKVGGEAMMKQDNGALLRLYSSDIQSSGLAKPYSAEKAKSMDTSSLGFSVNQYSPLPVYQTKKGVLKAAGDSGVLEAARNGDKRVSGFIVPNDPKIIASFERSQKYY